MKSTEAVALAFENLWRMKSRALFTTSGVAIAIGALVSMLSFSSGVQSNLSREFQELGLFQTLQIFPRLGAGDGQENLPPLDVEALDRIASVPGVEMAYPQLSFAGEAELEIGTMSAKIQGLPAAASSRPPFRQGITGRFFESDRAREAVVSRAWIRRKRLKLEAVLDQPMVIRTAGKAKLIMGILDRDLRRAGVPGEIAGLIIGTGESIASWIFPDSVRVTVVGVAEIDSGIRGGLGGIFIPIEVAQGIDHLPFTDPLELMAMTSAETGRGWRMIVATLTDHRDVGAVRDRIEGLGFRVHSFLDDFREVKRAFILFEGLIGAIGIMALMIASLGIVNTLVMAITERTREIGIMKSLGAEEGEIRLLFLLESAFIGLMGSLLGIALGWSVSRLLAWLIRQWMVSQRMPGVDLFALTWPVVIGAILFGVVISMIAGWYPASRAARVDPVEALRTG